MLLHQMIVALVLAAGIPIGLAQAPPPTVPAICQTAFMYEGDLSLGGAIVDEAVDLEFRLFADEVGGEQVGPTLWAPDCWLSDGAFVAELDFQVDIGDGVGRWLEISVNGMPIWPRDRIVGMLPAGPESAEVAHPPRNAAEPPAPPPAPPPGPEDDPAGSSIERAVREPAPRGRAPGDSGSPAFPQNLEPFDALRVDVEDPEVDDANSIAPEQHDRGGGGRSTGWQLNGTKIYYATGPVGVGFANPVYPLDVRAAAPISAFVENPSMEGVTHAIYARTRSPGGRAVLGNALGSTGTAIGVMGYSSTDRGRGGQFVATSPTGANTGLYAQTFSDEGWALITRGRTYMDGPLGIGKGSPQYELDVNGTINAAAMYLNGQLIQGGGWSLNGNSGTTAGAQFLGTTDAQPLEIHVNSARALRLEPHPTSPNIIFGNPQNATGAGYGNVICGGGDLNDQANQIGPSGTSYFCGIAGGHSNVIENGGASSIGGGVGNYLNGDWSSIGGGQANSIDFGGHSAIVGGYNNRVSDDDAFIGGGRNNVASNDSAVICGGDGNLADGANSVILGGAYNQTARAASYSLAAGKNAHAMHTGSFVWASGSGNDVESAIDNDFTARAPGGFRLFTNSAMTSGANLPGGSGSWGSLSDRSMKVNLESTDERNILERLCQLDVTTWSYKTQDSRIRHIGPMAQDFYAAFGVGEDDRHITTVDADGVAMAAIQGLNQIVQEKDREIAELRQRLERLETAVSELTKTDRATGGPANQWQLPAPSPLAEPRPTGSNDSSQFYFYLTSLPPRIPNGDGSSAACAPLPSPVLLGQD